MIDSFEYLSSFLLNFVKSLSVLLFEMNNKSYELKNGKGYIKQYNDNGILEKEGEYSNCKWKSKRILC